VEEAGGWELEGRGGYVEHGPAGEGQVDKSKRSRGEWRLCGALTGWCG
jgi:hypothetical protein